MADTLSMSDDMLPVEKTVSSFFQDKVLKHVAFCAITNIVAIDFHIKDCETANNWNGEKTVKYSKFYNEWNELHNKE